MAENLKNGEKLSMTSSDLGSSCCDNDVDASSDVKDKSDDVISVAGSTSLTIDSLEEEEETKEQSSQVPTATTSQSEMSKSSNSKNQPKKHQAVDSELEVHSQNRNGNDGASESKSAASEVDNADLRGVESERQKTGCGNRAENSRQNSASRAKSDEPHLSHDDHDGKLLLRKSRSLTDESSSDPSPKLPRRSAIPRRKDSGQCTVTAPSPGRGTPLGSPAPPGRTLTLDSAAGDGDVPGMAAPRSLPTSPVKGSGGLRRSASQCECCPGFGVPCPPLALSRDNVTSRLRFEKHHQDHGRGAGYPGIYLTPSQRKDAALKQLRVRVKELSRMVEDKAREVEDLRRTVEQERLQVRQEVREEVQEAQESAEAARKEVSSLQESHTESVKKVATLQQQLDDVKKDMRNKLAESEQIFLEMYNKGRQSAIFEHEEEMEIKRKGGRSPEATEKELHTKLVKCQAELAKWQTIQRHESYHSMPVPGTEAETTLRFLKDSVFHYLTTDKAASDEHLRAIVRILHFSEGQRERIAHAIILKRNKTGW